MFERFNDAQNLFFAGRVVALRGVQFARVECHWFAFLHNHRAKLIVGGISLDMEALVMVWVTNECFFGKYGLYCLKELFAVIGPSQVATTNLSCQWSEEVRTTGEHVTVEGDCANKGT